jgi:acetyltransferase-like isoleucine patch superfamily enzyme
MNVFDPRVKIIFRRRLSRLLWSRRLGQYGRGTRIGKVKIVRPKQIFTGIDCFIDDYAILNADGAPDSSITLGINVVIREQAILEAHKGSIKIGDHSFVGQGCRISGQGGLTIGNDTMIAANTVVIPSNHNIDSQELPYKNQGETSLGITIGDNCWIGANCTVLDGVVMEKGTILAAGSVLNRSAGEGNVILGGSPARILKRYSAKTGRWERVEGR